MRFTLCVVMLAVCFVALQCTVNATEGQDNNNGQDRADGSKAVVTITTTTAPEKPSSELQNSGKQENDRAPADEVEKIPAAEDEDSADDQDQVTEDSKVKGDRNNAAPGPQHQQQAQSPPQAEVQTTTTITAVKQLSDTNGAKVQEQSTQLKDGVSAQNNSPEKGRGATEPEVKEKAAVSTSTTTTATALSTKKMDFGETQTTTSTATSPLLQSIALSTTSQNKTTIQKPVEEKNDGTRSTSLLFAFTIINTFTAIPIALAFYNSE